MNDEYHLFAAAKRVLGDYLTLLDLTLAYKRNPTAIPLSSPIIVNAIDELLKTPEIRKHIFGHLGYDISDNELNLLRDDALNEGELGERITRVATLLNKIN